MISEALIGMEIIGDMSNRGELLTKKQNTGEKAFGHQQIKHFSTTHTTKILPPAQYDKYNTDTVLRHITQISTLNEKLM